MPVKFAPVSDINGQACGPQARATGFTPVKNRTCEIPALEVAENPGRIRHPSGASGAAGRAVARRFYRLFCHMELAIIAVGQRMPAWAQAAWDDCAKRFPPELKVQLKATKAEPRV